MRRVQPRKLWKRRGSGTTGKVPALGIRNRRDRQIGTLVLERINRASIRGFIP